MRKLVYGLLGGVCLGLLGVSTYGYVEKQKWENAEVITLDGGGSIFEYIEKYNRWRAEGKKVRIEGHCMSACTYFLGLMPREDVCVSDYAYLGFHGVYINFMGQMFFIPEYSLWVRDYVYDKATVDFLLTKGFDFQTDVVSAPGQLGMIWAAGAELGVQSCEDVV